MDQSTVTRSLRFAPHGIAVLFSVIGWGLLAGAVVLALRAEEVRKDWISAEGTIVDYTDGETDAPIVEYETPNGETRRVTGGVSSSPRAGNVGDRVPVYIDPENDENVRLGTALELWFAPGLLGAIGGVFVVVGSLSGAAIGAGRLPDELSARRMKTLRETGERVMARVTEVIRIGESATRRAPAHWRLRAEWSDPRSGEIVVFVSQPIKIDPAPHVSVGDEIGVFIDRGNPKVYAFDFSILPFGS